MSKSNGARTRHGHTHKAVGNGHTAHGPHDSESMAPDKGLSSDSPVQQHTDNPHVVHAHQSKVAHGPKKVAKHSHHKNHARHGD
jgi:hypothetical protein